MVCAGICHGGRTQLKIVQGTLNAVKYRDDIHDPIALPFLQQRNFDHVFQHDNARCHVAHVFQEQNFDEIVIGWFSSQNVSGGSALRSIFFKF